VTIFFLRITQPEKSVIPTETDRGGSMLFNVLLNNLMVILITLKIMFFLRVSESFANLVKLMADVVTQIGPFTIFLVMWLITVSLMYAVSGIDPLSSGDYDNIGTVAPYLF
jgi:hypothetical protein